MHAVVYTQWSRANLDEALSLVGSPTGLSLAIFAELRLCEVVVRVYTNSLETIRTELEDGSTCDVALRRSQHSLDVWHDRLKILTLVEEHTIPVGNLILPILLPLAKCALLQ